MAGEVGTCAGCVRCKNGRGAGHRGVGQRGIGVGCAHVADGDARTGGGIHGDGTGCSKLAAAAHQDGWRTIGRQGCQTAASPLKLHDARTGNRHHVGSGRRQSGLARDRERARARRHDTISWTRNRAVERAAKVDERCVLIGRGIDQNLGRFPRNAVHPDSRGVPLDRSAQIQRSACYPSDVGLPSALHRHGGSARHVHGPFGWNVCNACHLKKGGCQLDVAGEISGHIEQIPNAWRVGGIVEVKVDRPRIDCAREGGGQVEAQVLGCDR